MQKSILIIFFVLFIHNTSLSDVELVFFYETGCPECRHVDSFLSNRIAPNYPVDIIKYEIHHSDNAGLMLQLAEIYQSERIREKGTPAVFIGDEAFQGISRVVQRGIEQAVRTALHQHAVSPLSKIPESKEKNQTSQKLTLPAVISAAAVDAVNPCACAVLVLLLGTILLSAKHERNKILGAGFAFTAACFISYFMMGLGLFHAVQIAGIEQYIYIFVSVLAIVIGMWNIKDYFWHRRWFSIEVPKSWQPTVKRITSNITSVPGAFFSGLAVSILLLPCTSGPYVVIIGMLSKTATRIQAVLYLLLYNFIFVLPFLVITVVVGLGFTTTAKVETWRQKKSAVLHLLTGILMLGLGLVMIGMVLLGFI